MPRPILTRAAIPALLVAFVLLTACNTDKAVNEQSNVKPPAPGTPASISAVTGIYRTIHQGLLQLRADGSFVMIVPEGPGPLSGTFTLDDGRLEVNTDKCAGQSGRYDLAVTGKQKAGEAVLNFTAIDDPCAARRQYLTIDPWVYANS